MNTGLALNAQSRFPVLNVPVSAPAKCAFCGIGHNDENRRLFIDTSLDLDFYGVVYMCSTCLNEIAESLGYVSNDKWGGLKLNLNHVIELNEILKAENDGLRDAVNILTGHRCNDINRINQYKDETPAEVNDPEPPGGIVEGIEPEKPNSDELDSEPRLPDVRGTSKSKSAKPVSNANDPLAEFDL